MDTTMPMIPADIWASYMWNKKKIQATAKPLQVHLSDICANFVAIDHNNVHKWAVWEIRKIAGCACARIAGNVFPATTG